MLTAVAAETIERQPLKCELSDDTGRSGDLAVAALVDGRVIDHPTAGERVGRYTIGFVRARCRRNQHHGAVLNSTAA